MEIKTTLLGGLIYATMGWYLLASAGLFARKRWGVFFYAGGFLTAVAFVVVRAIQSGQPPLQNLFEVFLFLAMLLPVVSWYFRKAAEVGGEAFDALSGVVLLFPAGFVFSAELRPLPPLLQSIFFVPHVMAYMLAYVMMIKAGLWALGSWKKNGPLLEQHNTQLYLLVRLGFVFMTAGLLLGSVWGKQAWGDYWNWDPKELWALATWLTYAAMLHYWTLRKIYPRGVAIFVVLGMVLVIITLVWVNLSRMFAGLHSYA